MYLKIIQSHDQYEIYRYENAPLETKHRISRRGVERGPRRVIQRSFANTRRARKDFIRLVRSNLTGESCPSFLTLTMRDIVSVEVAYSCLKGFFRTFRDIVGPDFKYIAVPEYQKRGAVHFHILLWGCSEEMIKNERSTRTIQNLWALGYVDIVPTDGNPKLAGYLGKYMSKSLLSNNLGFSKAYTCSRNVLRPVSHTSLETLKIPDGFWSGDNVVLTERKYEVPWLGECTYQLLVKRNTHGDKSNSS